MILVTGATGNVGHALVAQLAAGGVAVRALSRSPGALTFPPGVELVRGDLTDAAGFGEVLRGVDALFLFTPPGGSDAAALAARHGVRHIVLLSSAVVERADPRANAIAARHAAAESAVRDCGASWTLLRPDSFAANALAWAASIRSEGVVRAAFGASLRNPIHEADVAAVAMRALLEECYAGAILELTGPAAIAQAEQVAVIGRAIGRRVRFEELPPDVALAEMCTRMPAPVAERLLAYAARSVEHAPAVTATVQEVTGRPARSFAEWAADHAGDFRAS